MSNHWCIGLLCHPKPYRVCSQEDESLATLLSCASLRSCQDPLKRNPNMRLFLKSSTDLSMTFFCLSLHMHRSSPYGAPIWCRSNKLKRTFNPIWEPLTAKSMLEAIKPLKNFSSRRCTEHEIFHSHSASSYWCQGCFLRQSHVVLLERRKANSVAQLSAYQFAP